MPSPPTAAAPASALETSGIEVATSAENSAVERGLPKPQLPEDDWALEVELRDVQRLLTSLKSRPVPGNEATTFHVGHPPLPAWHAEARSSPARDSGMDTQDAAGSSNVTTTSDDSTQQSHSVAWVVLSVSLAVFTCGSVLLVWSLLGQRDDLWPVGLPLALIGQAGLMLGVVLQLDGLRVAATRATGRSARQPVRPRRRRRVASG